MLHQKMPSGGCEPNIQTGISVVAIAVAILFVWYVSMYIKDRVVLTQNAAIQSDTPTATSTTESMCGSLDQMCHCGGNETFVGDTFAGRTVEGHINAFDEPPVAY
jgi:hypothetical protein